MTSVHAISAAVFYVALLSGEALAQDAATTAQPAATQAQTSGGQKKITPDPAAGFELDAAPSADPLTPQEDKGPAPAAPRASGESESQGSPREAQVAAETQDPLTLAVRDRAKKFNPSRGDNKADADAITAYFADETNMPLWVGKNGFNPAAKEAVTEIRKANEWGLDASAFELPTLAPSETNADDLANAEIKLSLAALKYARHARGGRIDPVSLSPMMDRKPVIYDPKTVLQGLASTSAPGSYLQGLHPKHPQFQRLRRALLSATPSEAVGLVKIPSGPDLRPGDRHPQVALLRERLKIRADRADDDVYDEQLSDAVRRQQQERGFHPTGIFDKKVRTALNEASSQTPDERRQRILVNMERWRWMPENLGPFYVWDSIPEQLARVFDGGKQVLLERIVVGRPSTPTPQFSANMQFVIFHPEWGVPDGIKTNELAPRLRRYSGNDGGFLFFGGGDGGASRVLRSQGLRVSLNGREVDPDTVNWSSVDVKRYQFIQPSGGRNVLGIVKFRFPNKHDVYMHDTPDKGLFGERVRAYSHGCMRTQNPLHLAEVILAYDKGWSPNQVKDAIARGQTAEVKLTKQVPVHVTYFTAEADEDGKLRTFGDIYGIDGRVASALAGRTITLSGPQPVASATEDSPRPQQKPRARVSERSQDRERERDRSFRPFGDLFSN